MIEEQAREDIAFNEILASRVRLAIVAFLAGAGTADFAAVRDATKTTGGNAGIHLRKLEDAGYVEMQKRFVARKPQTLYSLTEHGRQALLAYVARLTIDVEQRLKITSLTFLFTDLKGSTELYERVGDLAAFDLVRAHFRVLNEIVAAEAGAVVKTIGDAVMATFPTPDRAISAALRMREAMRELNGGRDGEDLLLKIGIHEGPCLAVVLNDRQDYFGRTVNTAARVQALAGSRSILATQPVIADPQTSNLLKTRGLEPVAQTRALPGIVERVPVYEIP
jgi:class 3 adenylate cyclase